MPRPTPWIAALLLLVLVVPAQAQTMYDVEILVFEQPAERFGDGERWRPVITIPRLDRTLDFAANGEPIAEMEVEIPDGFHRLDADKHRLGAERRRLERSSAYTLLEHLAWRQPGVEPEQSVGVHIRAGKPFTVSLPVRGDDRLAAPVRIEEILAQARSAGGDRSGEPTAAESASQDDDQAGRRQLVVYPLDGSVRVEVRRYLHVYADLYYTAAVDAAGEDLAEHLQAEAMRRTAERDSGAATPDQHDPSANGGADDSENGSGADRARDPGLARGSGGEPVISYPFVQQRRMRSGERHYLDHPVIGMIVLITPREEDEADDGE